MIEPCVIDAMDAAKDDPRFQKHDPRPSFAGEGRPT